MCKSLITSILCMLFFACSNSQKPLIGDLQELNLGSVSLIDELPFIIAQKLGIYDSLGLTLNRIKFSDANERDIAFQAGSIDGTSIDFAKAMMQQANGIDLKVIMKSEEPFYFIVGKESEIHSINDLKEKNIAVPRNPAIQYFTDYILQKKNVSADEVNKPEIDQTDIRLKMLQNAQIDASIFTEPDAGMAIRNGHRLILTSQELKVPTTGVIFTAQALKNKEREIKLLIQGYNLAIAYIQNHPRSEWQAMLAEETELPEELIVLINFPDYQLASCPKLNELTAIIEWMKMRKLIPEAYNGALLIDTTFVY